MKRWLYRVVLCVVVVMPLLSAAPAQADDALIVFSDASWLVPCSTGQGLVSYTITVFVPANYRVVHRWTWGDDPIWGEGANAVEFVEPTGWTLNTSFYWLIGTPGWQDEVWAVYDPTGLLVSTAYFHASCATGEIILQDSNVYGPHQPDSSERVEGLVLHTTAVYGAANPDTRVDGAVLLAGQTWFVVDETTGTDGAQWYQVYISGSYAWVPADAMALAGPIP